MKPVEFVGQNLLLGPPPQWNEGADVKCGSLPVCVVEGEQGTRCFNSIWQPSREEIEALAAGACIRLVVTAASHPMVWVDVQDVEVLP